MVKSVDEGGRDYSLSNPTLPSFKVMTVELLSGMMTLSKGMWVLPLSLVGLEMYLLVI
jgi:hypothetical protein